MATCFVFCLLGVEKTTLYIVNILYGLESMCKSILHICWTEGSKRLRIVTHGLNEKPLGMKNEYSWRYQSPLKDTGSIPFRKGKLLLTNL